MPSLTDIAAITEKVTVQGIEFDVRGLGARDIASLLAQFPELRLAWVNRDVPAERWFELVPDAVPKVIVAGLGRTGDQAEEEAADRLPIEDQMTLISAIWRLTMPNGIGPFADQVRGLVEGRAAALSKAPATN